MRIGGLQVAICLFVSLLLYKRKKRGLLTLLTRFGCGYWLLTCWTCMCVCWLES